MKYDKDNVLDMSDPNVPVPYEEFVDRELIHFSNRDLERSIPHMCDGLKESIRKILFGCFKKKLYGSSIKVAQLAAYVSEVSAYHHGEVSLQQAIVGMAQNYVGSNNINLLTPEGQFGTRLNGGKDAASARYIFTQLSKLAKLIFREEDMCILHYLNDDGTQVEPEYYIPIIPMVLVNGSIGIGTGFSTTVPCHNPEDVIAMCERIAEQETSIENIDELELDDIAPWYLGFKGAIAHHKPGMYQSRGLYNWTDDVTVEIAELPVGTWTDDYKEYLNALLVANSPVLKDFESHSTAKNVKFILKFYPGTKDVVNKTFVEDFKLSETRGLSLNNMHLISTTGAIRKFGNTVDVVKEWAKVRLLKYAERKQSMLDKMEYDYTILSAKVRFIKEIVEQTLSVMNVKKAVLDDQLRAKEYPQEAVKGKSDTAVDTDTDINDNAEGGGWNYLTRMPIYQLTSEKKIALEKQATELDMRIQELKAKTIHQIWMSELVELRTAWAEYKSEVESEYEADKDTAKASGAAAKKRRAPVAKKK
jgi:DNA topoisomerase-2